MKRIVLNISLIILVTCVLINFYNCVYADSLDTVIDSMSSASTPDTDTSNGIVSGINTVIGIIQYTGTGISLIVVTLLGIKYIIASPQDKADVKKQIMPILIGCILLFGAVNLMKVAETMGTTIFNGSGEGGGE